MFENLTERLANAMRAISGRGKLTEENIKETLREVRRALLEADVALAVVRTFTDRVQAAALDVEVSKSLTPGQAFIKIVQRELTVAMGERHQTLNLQVQPPAVILMVGLQGAGKTTTVAKLARFLQRQKKRKILVASADIYRPAAIQQLQRLAEEVGVDFYTAEAQEDAVAIASGALHHAQAKFYDLLIVDTAGRLHIDEGMMREIQQIQTVLKPVEILLVVDAMMGQDAVTMAKTFDDHLPLTGSILSKVDGDTRGGAALSIRHVTGKPLKFIGVGEKNDALEPFHPDRMANRILGMGDMLSLIETLEHKADVKKNQQLVKKISRGAGFNFDDFAEQLKQMRNMGGMIEVLNKLPGAHQLPQQLKAQLDDKILIRTEAIISSMTSKERRAEVEIKGSRKRRIAAGAGVLVQEVNQLLKQFDEMQSMMKKMRSGGLGKMMRGLQSVLPQGFGRR